MPRGNGDEDCGGKSMAPAWRAPEYRGERYRPVPWHFLYFRPDPQGQGSFRPTSGTAAVARPTDPSELLTAGAPLGPRGGEPVKRSSVLGGAVPAAANGAGPPAGRRAPDPEPSPPNGPGGRLGPAIGGSGRGGSALTWI